MPAFLMALLAILITIPISLLRGIVLSDLISWFTPYEVSVVQAIGISIIVTMLIHRAYKADENSEIFETLIHSTLIALFSWGFGYLWHLAM